MRNLQALFVTFLLIVTAASQYPSKARREAGPVPSKARREVGPVPSKARREAEAVPSYQRREPEPAPSSKKRREVQQDVLVNENGTLNCDAGFTSCPISPLDTRHECVNMKGDLENCGACGNICGKGKGERTSSCTEGLCVVSSCRPGYTLNEGICERN
ncbi:hypothetical protein JOM56_009066 [Amanita muscaria]